MAGAVRAALTMHRDERRRRMQALRKVVRENNIYKWAGKLMRCVLEVQSNRKVLARPDREMLALVSGM